MKVEKEKQVSVFKGLKVQRPISILVHTANITKLIATPSRANKTNMAVNKLSRQCYKTISIHLTMSVLSLKLFSRLTGLSKSLIFHNIRYSQPLTVFVRNFRATEFSKRYIQTTKHNRQKKTTQNASFIVNLHIIVYIFKSNRMGNGGSNTIIQTFKTFYKI